MHLTISWVRRKIFQVQNHLCKSRQFTVRSGHGRLVVRGACGLVEGIIIQRRAMPENGHSWWPEHMRRNCESQKLNPGRNLQARQQVRRKRKKCTLNLSISMLCQMLSRRLTRRCRMVMRRETREFLQETRSWRAEGGGAQEVAYCGETISSTLDGHGHRVGAT